MNSQNPAANVAKHWKPSVITVYKYLWCIQHIVCNNSFNPCSVATAIFQSHISVFLGLKSVIWDLNGRLQSQILWIILYNFNRKMALGIRKTGMWDGILWEMLLNLNLLAIENYDTFKRAIRTHLFKLRYFNWFTYIYLFMYILRQSSYNVDTIILSNL